VRNTLVLCATGILLAGAAVAQQPEYLDELRVTVRPEKRTEFEAAVRKMAEANRGNNGDHWVTISTEYGEGDTFTFVSGRSSYADIDKGLELFEGAIAKSAGPEGMKKLMEDYRACILHSRGEIRKVRWDLSPNIGDPAAFMMKTIATSRWVRTSRVLVKPGRTLDYESQVKTIKTAVEKSGTFRRPVHIAQTMDGTAGPAYYVSMFGAKLGDFDDLPKLSTILGEEGFRSYMKTVAEVVVSGESAIGRFVPELSSVPKEFADVAPDFWNAKK
jgi:hypothetical protein